MSSLPFVFSISSYVHTLYERIEKCVNYQRAVKLLYMREPAATCARSGYHISGDEDGMASTGTSSIAVKTSGPNMLSGWGTSSTRTASLTAISNGLSYLPL